MSSLLDLSLHHVVASAGQLLISAALHTTNDESGAVVVPSWVHLVPAGSFSGRDGRGPYLLDGPAVLKAFSEWGMPVAIDYEHQSEMSAENGQPAPAAGWIQEIEVRDGALWGRVEWNERAANFIAAKEYRYLSPVFCHEKDGRIFLLCGCGLTNSPNLYLTAFNSARFKKKKENHSMDELQQDAAKEIAERLRYIFGLPTMSSMADILVALKNFIGLVDGNGAAAMRTKLGVSTTHAAGLLLALHSQLAAGQLVAKEELDNVQSAHDKLLAETQDKACQAAFADAVAAGKILPAHKDMAMSHMAAKGLDDFVNWAKTAPIVGPVGKVATHAAVGSHGQTTSKARHVVIWPQGEAVNTNEMDLHIRVTEYASQHNVSYREALRAVKE